MYFDAGAATGAPHYIPLYYDTVRSTLDIEDGDAVILAAARPSNVKNYSSRTRRCWRRLVAASARESIGLRSLKGVSVVLTDRRPARGKPSSAPRRGPWTTAKRFRVGPSTKHGRPSTWVYLGRLAATKRTAHLSPRGRRAGRAFVQLNLEDATPTRLSSSARAEALKTTDEAASCISLLMLTRAAAATRPRGRPGRRTR